jgi:predicted ester cyclase
MTSQQTQAEANKAIIRRYRQAHEQNDMAGLDEIIAADLIAHSQLPNVPAGREGGKMVHQSAVAAFPDGKTTTDDLIAEGDKVVERFRLVGTHKGDFMGIPATGKPIKVTDMSIFRIANGKIVDHWGENDAMSLLMQLGVLPAPGQ